MGEHGEMMWARHCRCGLLSLQSPCLQEAGAGAGYSPGGCPPWVSQAQGRSALSQVRLLACEACMLAVHGRGWCRTCCEPSEVATAVSGLRAMSLS